MLITPLLRSQNSEILSYPHFPGSKNCLVYMLQGSYIFKAKC